MTEFVINPEILLEEELIRYWINRIYPMARPGTDSARRAAVYLINNTARLKGISFEAAMRQATTPPDYSRLINNPNSFGYGGEIYAADQLNRHIKGWPHNIINPPRIHPETTWVHPTPDFSSKPDLTYQNNAGKGKGLFYHPGPGVKTGNARNIFRDLIVSADKPGYPKKQILSAHLVNPDGSGRVGLGLFTEDQSQRLRQAGYKFIGIDGLREAGESWQEGAREYVHGDGYTPKQRVEQAHAGQAREQVKAQQEARQEQQRAKTHGDYYTWKGAGERVATGGVVGALFGGVASMLSQVVETKDFGKINWKKVGVASGVGGAVGGTTAAAEIGIFRAIMALKWAPTQAAARSAAGGAVGSIAFGISAFFDIRHEVRAAKSGELFSGDAIDWAVAKVSLSGVCVGLCLLGPLGIAAAFCAGIGGQLVIEWARKQDVAKKKAFDERNHQEAQAHAA